MNVKSGYAAFLWSVIFSMLATGTALAQSPSEREAKTIIEGCRVWGGLVVHVGCGDGSLTAALRASEAYMVHGLDRDAENVGKARQNILAKGLYGPVAVDLLRGDRLPYVDNLVNLLVIEEEYGFPRDEIMRVLAPGGKAYFKRAGIAAMTVKPPNKEMDDWSHYLYDASNNAVSKDSVVGPPRRLQWTAGPRYSRHHDRMSSVPALVSADGRVYYIMDEGSRVSILLPAKWKLIARDAFNGTVLWKRNIEKWHTHLWPLKSGPAQNPRRLVAKYEKVYVTLGLNAPVEALDAATGETVRTYEGTEGAEEIILSRGILYALVQDPDKITDGSDRFAKGYGATMWDEEPRKINGSCVMQRIKAPIFRSFPSFTRSEILPGLGGGIISTICAPRG